MVASNDMNADLFRVAAGTIDPSKAPRHDGGVTWTARIDTWGELLGDYGIAAIDEDDDASGVTPAPIVPADPRVVDCRILVVCDDLFIGRVLRTYLRSGGYRKQIDVEREDQVLTTARVCRPDLVVLDAAALPDGGIDVLRLLRADPITALVPVLLITATVDADLRVRALQHGATDFLAKPLDASELLPRVNNTLRNKLHEDELRGRALAVEQKSRLQGEEVERSRLDAVHCLARAAEHRDSDTGHHILRVGRYSGIVARKLGLPASQAQAIELAAPLHDVGKIGVPDEILLKPGRLDPDEMAVVRRHAEVGANILGDPSGGLLRVAQAIAISHHERFDGGGYPHRIGGQEIPIEGRIVAVADVFDALSTRRIYKRAIPVVQCFAQLADERGRHFDPEVFDAFVAAAEEIKRTRLLLADG